MSFNAINPTAARFYRGVQLRSGCRSSKGAQTITGQDSIQQPPIPTNDFINPFKLPVTPDIPTIRIMGYNSDKGR